jgi:hypothetical protein
MIDFDESVLEIQLWILDLLKKKENPVEQRIEQIFDVVQGIQDHLNQTGEILKSLSSDAYLAKVGDNQGFILMHSVGSLPNGSEIDTPLNYADYYYLEALKRFMELKKLRVEHGELRMIQ